VAINEAALGKILKAVKLRLDQQRDVNQRIISILKKLTVIDRQLEQRSDSGDDKVREIDDDLKELAKSVDLDLIEVKRRNAERDKLSKAEKPVFDLYVAMKYSNKEIAKRLNLSEDTVKNHIKSIRRKTDIARGRKEKYKGDAL
jgi:DNA-binding CsgD family transcriptional regulator